MPFHLPTLSRTRRYAAGALLTAATLGAGLQGCTSPGHVSSPDFEPQWDKLVVTVHEFEDRQPTGVAVSDTGRVFVTFPYWDDQPTPAVAEVLEDGSLRPYPSNSWNRWDGEAGPSALRSFVCAQAAWVDENNDLWVLDAGNPRGRDGIVIAGPKLFRFDLADDTIEQVFYFDHERDFVDASYPSDFRVDTRTNTAYITDSGRGGIYVVDLKTRQTHNVLLAHRSTKAEPGVSPIVGSTRWLDFLGRTPQVNVAGIELSPDGQWLYYHALTGRTLYRVPADLVRNPNISDAQRAASVENLGSTGSAIDGMFMDPDGDLYLTAIEQDAILVRRADTGAIETFVADQRLRWPDSLALAPDGYLYFTTSLRHLQAPYQFGVEDEPYFVMKASIDKVEKAIEARKHADQKAAELAQARAKVEEARASAQARAQAQAEADRLAEQQAQAAQAAQLGVQTAQRVHQDAAQRADSAAAEQQAAAEQAAQASESAEVAAQTARAAAEKAAEAARIARAMAESAQARAAEMAQAVEVARASKADAERARAAREAAVYAFEKAAETAQFAANFAQQRLADAAEADRFAAEAALAAQQEAQAAEELKALAAEIRLSYEEAERFALAAELAEIKPGAETAIADVPTD
ncbi:MAG: L-dopachrome tautomerase-related protein [Planctomycetota bacterium]